jgi:hypothetical protein
MRLLLLPFVLVLGGIGYHYAEAQDCIWGPAECRAIAEQQRGLAEERARERQWRDEERRQAEEGARREYNRRREDAARLEDRNTRLEAACISSGGRWYGYMTGGECVR